MSESNFSFTSKINYDLLTVRGDNFEEFAANVDALLDHADVLVDKLTALQGALNAAPLVHVQSAAPAAPATPPAAEVTSGPSPWGAPSTPAAPAQPPASFNQAAKPTCTHGYRKPVAKGNWKAWFCPTDQGDPSKCEPIWVDRKSPEWDAFPV